MNSIVSRYASSSAITQRDLDSDDVEDVGDAMWGSTGGFAIGAAGVPSFAIPRVPDVSHPITLCIYPILKRYEANCVPATAYR